MLWLYLGGCQGGTQEIAFAQLIKSGGLTSEWTYPYTSYFGNNYQCHANGSTPPVLLPPPSCTFQRDSV